MRWIFLWCAVAGVMSQAPQDHFYAPQTFRNHVRAGAGAAAGLFSPERDAPRRTNHIESYQKHMFTPATYSDVSPQGSYAEPWRPVAPPAPHAPLAPLSPPAPVHEPWRDYGPAPIASPLRAAPPAPRPAQYSPLPQAQPWTNPHPTKEQQAAIIHHKQALSSEGSFRFEYASDNGLAAGEVIEPDGSRVGSYQYKDPSGQLVKMKYRAGKDGFQILEGSHLPKSPEPVPPPTQDQHYRQAYEEQRRQYDLQQQYNQQKYDPAQNQAYEGGQRTAAAGQHYASWRPQGQEDDGQYRENEVEDQHNKGPHTFGEGYAFEFQG